MFTTQPKPRPRLAFLDGLRGLCALYVALYHASLFTGYGKAVEAYSPVGKALMHLLSFGPYSVAVFIVLSGFVIGLPVAKTPDLTLRGGFWAYIMRRARRILPPYYAALGLFLLLIALIPVLHVQGGTAWDSKIPVTWNAVLSHLLLLHNLHPDWSLKIDGPMWSVATEWQIYFFFPLLLVFWRRFSLGVALVVAFAIGLAPQFLLPEAHNLSWMSPWFLGLFALGMMGSAIVFSPTLFWQRARQRWPWRSLALASAGLTVATLLGDRLLELPQYVSEPLVGLFVTTIVAYFALLEVEGAPRPFVLRLLNWPSVVFLGAFSYSIYLIHSPLLGLFNLLTLELPLAPDLRLLLMLAVAVPLAILCSYVFYLLVERHFLSGHQRALKDSTATAEPLHRVHNRRALP